MSNNFIGYSNKDYSSLLAALQDLALQQLPEWTDRSPNDLGVMLLELFCAMGDSLFYNMDRIAGESFLDSAVERRSIMNHLRLIGYELRAPLPASADLTLLFDANATGSVTISQFSAFKTTAAATGKSIVFEYVLATPISFVRDSLPLFLADASGRLLLDARGAPRVLPAGQTPPPGATPYRAYQSLPVVQVDANVSNEIVASSDGSAGQRYMLKQSPVIDDTLVISVNEGAGPVIWSRVPSLLSSGPADMSYQIRRDENEAVWVEFGGGAYGRAPLRGLNNITATYSVGGGTKGNVQAYAISKPVTPVDQLKLVANLGAASGGAPAEALAEAVRRGPQQFRAGGRAVTASDYVTLAQAFFSVAKAQAIATGWNRVLLIVAPSGGGQPSATLVEDLLAFLRPKIMLGTILDVAGPRYSPVYLDATIYCLPQYDAGFVAQKVKQAVADLLAFERVSFNQTLYISRIYDVIQEVSGVVGVNITTFATGPEYNAVAGAVPANGQLVFGLSDPSELPYWSGFDESTSHLTVQPRSG